MPELYSTTNLIINNIPSVISDEQLNKLFCAFGSIKSCKIIRSNEKDSKAFGFCEYNDARSAKQALSQLDNYRLSDRILKVSYAKLFPKPKGKCIEVINLPKSTQEEMVRKYFSQFGRIVRLRLIFNNTNGNHTKTSEIVYENKIDADKASLKNLIKWNYDNGKQVTVTVNLISPERSRSDRELLIDNKVVNANILYINSAKQLGDNHFYVQQSNFHHNSEQPQQQPQQQIHKTATPFDFSNLHSLVNFTPIYHHHQQPHNQTLPSFQYTNLAQPGFYSGPHLNNLSLHQLGPYHDIINDKSILHHSSGSIPLQYPFGYATYANSLPLGIPLMYAAPLAASNYPKSANQIVKADYVYGNSGKSSITSRNGNGQNCNSVSSSPAYVVYVYNIGNTTSKEQLRDIFAPKFTKEIVKVDVPKDAQNGSNKNFGFVTFGSFHKAQLAIQEMNGKEFQGKPLQVSFKR